MNNISNIISNAEPVLVYLEESKDKDSRIMERFTSYQLNEEVIKKLKKYVKNTVVLVFSAEWCPDCFRNVPILGLLNKTTGLKVHVLGHLKRNVTNPEENWKIPPSPEEVKEFKVIKIPHIIIFNNDGKILGEIIENPPEGKSLEEAILNILE